ncbi:MAG: tRNA (adenosine(37)-N6)-dimethylallyltransferase MiaA [Verrucomicrobiae bacterium]|nr:tRNA (adenosine(37)-N6)-dimethylallyltransferase MiaA [Verrucomicrobiae bacterium]
MSESPFTAQQATIDPVLYISGPTGSGKSAVALALAKSLGKAAIVNADAFQLYRGYEILSAAPSQRDQAEIPHHLYGVLSLTETCDAIRFADMARTVIDDLVSRDIQPIVAGGSGLYLKALTHGLAPTPAGDAELRAQLDDLSLSELVAWYQRLDPEGAAATNLLNRRYVTRNLEISLLSGKPASELKREFVVPEPHLRAVVLTREREDLYERINRRTAQMFQDGVVDEIRRLEGTPLSATAEKAIGLAEIRAFIRDETDQDSAIERIRQSTRHYAKRQLTWFRREKAFQSVCLDASETADSATDRILALFPELPNTAHPR